MGSIKIKISRYPIIIISAEEETHPEDVAEFYQEMQKVLDSHHGKFIIISDQANAKYMSGPTRIELGRSLQKISGKYREREEAVIVVNSSFIGKTMMRGLMLITQPNKNFFAVSTLDDALAKAEEIKNKITETAA